MNDPGPFDHLAKQGAVLLTSYKRDGQPVGTPVNIAVEDDHAFVRTYEKAWKFKRMRRNPYVQVAPSTFRGTPTGGAIPARARLLEGQEAKHASDALQHKHRILQGIMVPLAHRLVRHRTVHFELTAA
jgi:hypothetical protein